jgi:hypothetical protein
MNAIVTTPGQNKSMLVNLVQRTLSNIFPGYFPGMKHDNYRDFGYPDIIDFQLLYDMYQRNSLARAAVDKTTRKTWQDPPWLLEKPRDGSEGAVKKETRLEKAIRQHFSDIRFWTKLMEADRRSMVGRYGAVILRIADGKKTEEPLTKVSGGLDALVDIIPVWEGQLRVTQWDNDTMSLTYGEPMMFEYDEGKVGATDGASPADQGRNRRLTVHPSRLFIWSMDGTMFGDPALKSGFNDLITLEKITGSGGEGFWKNAKQAPILEMDKEADINKMARAMGVPVEKIADIMNEQAANWQKGFDELLMLQGMTAKLPKIVLPDPEHFYMNSLQSFAASFDIPLKVLVGTQTGERASSEDASQWNQTCNFRRKNTIIPNILQIVKRLEDCGILKENPEWFIDWTDLTESTMLEKIDRAGKMAKVNKDFGDIVFMPQEIRASVGYEPASEEEIAKLRKAKLPPPPTTKNPNPNDPNNPNPDPKKPETAPTPRAEK